MQSPLFDIIVPTYNRYSELTLFFNKLEGLDDSDCLLWLVDDGSPNIDRLVVPDWKNLRFIEMINNVGQAGARNMAIAKGSAPYLISLDDDAWFEDLKSSIMKIKDAFSKYTDAGCLMFDIATPSSHYKNGADGTELPLHVTCGCAYRRTAIEKIGGFSSILQGQVEETDLSLRLIKAGYKIRSLYSVKVFHDFDPATRTREWYLRIRYKNTRNDLAVVYMNYPFIKLFTYLPGKALSHLKFAFTNKVYEWSTAGVTIKAWFAFITWLPKLRRSPLSTSAFKYWYDLIKEKK